jgi:hypothetical protein
MRWECLAGTLRPFVLVHACGSVGGLAVNRRSVSFYGGGLGRVVSGAPVVRRLLA